MMRTVIPTGGASISQSIDSSTGIPVADKSTNGAKHVITQDASRFDIAWAAAGITNAPATSGYWQGAIGINLDGATGANIYHVIEIAGTLTWVDTGATVANLYGG